MAASGPERERAERERVRAALIQLVGEHGYRDVSIRELRQLARVDRARFARLFGDLDGCFSAVWEQVDAELDAKILAAVESGGGWIDRTRAAIAAYFEYLAEDPARARLYLVDAALLPEAPGFSRERSTARLIDHIDTARREFDLDGDVTHFFAEAAAGAVRDRAHRLILEGRAEALPEQVSGLMYMVLLPYVGAYAASRELDSESGD